MSQDAPVIWEPISLLALLASIGTAVAWAGGRFEQRSLRNRLRRDVEIYEKTPEFAKPELEQLIAAETKQLHERETRQRTTSQIAYTVASAVGGLGVVVVVAGLIAQAVRKSLPTMADWPTALISYGLTALVLAVLACLMIVANAVLSSWARHLWKRWRGMS